MKHLIIIIFNVLCVLNIAGFVYSEKIITLGSLIKEARERNPEIKSASKQWQSEDIERSKSAYILSKKGYLPDFAFSYKHRMID